MSFEPLIEVKALGKTFPVFDKPHHRLLQMMVGGQRRWYKEFHAIKDVSFAIERGETVGIVGRNGSGKSTLLQIICGTLTPTQGEVHVHGRVAALLELGAGFNPEFTGKENVYLNGAVLGLDRAEIDAKLAEIEAFADIGEFIDRPVKNYSSGMYVRLAFAVAIHVEPDLLVVDEALSVGDEAFQRKCFARIERLRQSGCTVLFVSHAAATVVELCDRAILLDGGEVLADGPPKAVISRYQRMLYAPADRVAELRKQMKQEWLSHRGDRTSMASEPHAVASAHGGHAKEPQIEAYYDEGLQSKSVLHYPSQGALIDDPHIETLQGTRVNVLNAGERYVYVYQVRFTQGATGVRFGMLIKTVTGVELAGSVSATADQAASWVAAGTTSSLRFEFDCRLAAGVYFMNAGVLGRMTEAEVFLDRRIDAAMFRVMGGRDRLGTGFVDLVGAVTAEWQEGGLGL